MKTIITTLATLITFTIFGQSNNKLVVFKHTYFDFDNKASSSENKALKVDKKLDFEFYKKHFNRPYHFPKNFINPNFINQTIEVWNDSTKPKDIKTNWTYTYSYDSLSRLSFYSYSSCFICGQQAFNIRITYDKINRPIRFSIRHSFQKNLPESERFEFTYDRDDNFIQLKHFSAGRIFEQIDKM